MTSLLACSGTKAMAIAVSAVLIAGCGSGSDSADGTTTSVTPTTATTEPMAPLTIVVTNDDGIGHAGIDVLVTALSELEAVEVVVVAPAEDRTGTSDSTTAGGAAYVPGATASGVTGHAVDGFPADTIAVALDELGIEADLVVSGINRGQNVGPIAYASGTVGAARAAVRRGVPAIAGSAGIPEDTDYALVAELIVAYIEEHRAEYASGAMQTDAVVSFNIPECTAGGVRVLVEVPLATDIPQGLDPFETDCSVEPSGPPADDVAAMVSGHAALTLVPPEAPGG